MMQQQICKADFPESLKGEKHQSRDRRTKLNRAGRFFNFP